MYREEQFISELNKKKDKAWRELYRNFYPALCAYAARITREETGVEDVVQECLIGLWDSALKFPDMRALAAWLYRAVYSRSLNLLRDRANARRLLSALPEEEETGEAVAVDMAIEEAVVARLRMVLAELSGQQREVMKLSMEGLKVREIAVRLGVTENTVKMQKKRAYAEVRERMGEVWGILYLSFFPHSF